MNIDTIRIIMTVLMFITLVGVFIWAWSSKTRPRFDEAEQLPFNEPEQPANKEQTS